MLVRSSSCYYSVRSVAIFKIVDKYVPCVVSKLVLGVVLLRMMYVYFRYWRSRKEYVYQANEDYPWTRLLR